MGMDATADASSARRRLVTRADGCVVLLESAVSTTDASVSLRVRELRVDAADRLISAADPGDPLPLPASAMLVAATEIVDVELAMLTTVVVLQVATASTDHTRPAKRLRLQTTPPRGSSALLFFSLWRDDHQRWRLDSFGDACSLPDIVDAVDVRLLDGPLAVVTQRSHTSEAPPLLVSCRQPATAATIDTGNDRLLSLVSCQLMDDRHSEAGRHLLLQLEEKREFMRCERGTTCLSRLRLLS
ncbi:hypothetical protein PINS_up007476 [Pythium insidiosum]|nr:hypothetical protein PINS_up007476 [Pythium insidiosum]